MKCHISCTGATITKPKRVQVWSSVRFITMSIVIIAEKPSVAEDLANVLVGKNRHALAQ